MPLPPLLCRSLLLIEELLMLIRTLSFFLAPLGALAGPASSQTSFQGIGDLPGRIFNSTAAAISADGSTVVGTGFGATGPEAFRWSTGSMTGIGFLAGGAVTRGRSS
jgi:probable HAF family extracellular repeat protein